MSLYREHRPKTLDEVVGNTAIVNGIREHFAQPASRISHAHIIYGPSGCGKTTLARCIARSILGADDLSIKEINKAENRGIDTARDIIAEMDCLPLTGKATVYIIDEAHGMTNDEKTAYLKPFEECPEHVFFFLCTTDLPKLLKGDAGKAISTRCTQWKVEPLNSRQLTRLVSNVAEKEHYELVPELLDAIVQSADGSPRAALVALEKVMPIVDDLPAQLKLLEGGAFDEDPETRTLCQLLCKGAAWAEVASALEPLKGKVDPETLRRGILGYAQAILLKRDDKRVAQVMEEFAIPTYDTGFPGITIACWRSGN